MTQPIAKRDNENAEIARLHAVIDSLRREVRTQRQEIAALREERHRTQEQP